MGTLSHYAMIILPIIEMVVLYGATVRLGWDLFSLWNTPLPSDSFYLTLLMCFLLMDSHHGEWLDIIILGGFATGAVAQAIRLALWDRAMRKRYKWWGDD